MEDNIKNFGKPISSRLDDDSNLFSEILIASLDKLVSMFAVRQKTRLQYYVAYVLDQDRKSLGGISFGTLNKV